MKTNNQKTTPEATYTYFYDGWLLVKEVVERSGDTRRCGVSPRWRGGAGSSASLGEDAAGSRVSMGETASPCLMWTVEEREA